MSNKLYNWDEIPSEVARKGITRKGFQSGNTMMVMNECQPGMEIRPHVHDFEQLCTFWQGKALFHIGDTVHEIRPGSILVVPAGATHYIEVLGDEPVLNMDIFSPPRADYAHLVKYQEEE